MDISRELGLVLVLASFASAQGFGGHGPPGGNYGGGPPGGYSGSNGDNSGPFGTASLQQFLQSRSVMVTVHAALATVVFGFFFPVGGIMIRVFSFRGLWLVHGIFQIIAYILYLGAAGIGIFMATNMRMMNQAHPIIGVIILVLLFFQPFLGFIHHVMFRKHSRRVVWSHGHIWLGRIVITLGIINGGLGLQLSQETRFFAPKESTIIGYSIAAGVMWLLYVAAAVYGETKRSRANKSSLPPTYKESVSEESAPGVPAGGVGEYYNKHHHGEQA